VASLTLTSTRTWTSVLFDLDGTLIDSAGDITASLAHMFSELDKPVPSEDVLRAYVGPPLLDSLQSLAGFSLTDALSAVTIYRNNYRDRVLRSPVFPGVAGLLERLYTTGLPVALATSKPENMARLVLEHTNLAPYFTVITGASEDQNLSTKADIIAETLRRLTALGINTDNPVMVGDRDYDVVGATANGIPTILVEWGYGSPAEAAEAIATVHSADQLRTMLLRAKPTVN